MSRELESRLEALRDAVAVAEGRLEEAAVEPARAVVARAGERLGLGLESTVVALAGPTGAGKSRLFNVLAGDELASVGRRRPTTSATQAAVWGEAPDPLLAWLGVARRHVRDADGLDGLVLLDLPDFDSIEAAHRAEAERVVALADLVLWVVEPQKYADASLHDRYLRPLATHAAAMAVVLNQADLLAADEVRAWREDMERLVAADGLPRLPLVVVSAETGAGVDELRRLLADRVAARDAALARLAADVDGVVAPLLAACAGSAAGVRGEDRRRLLAALEDAAGVPAIVRAVAQAHARRGALAAGWPFARWVRRFRPDPLRRLRLPDTPQPIGRTSVPPPTDVQRAQVASAARRLADGAAAGLPEPWLRLAREAAVGQEDRLTDRLERAVATADLRLSPPRWWRVAGWLQRLLTLAALAGGAWLVVLGVLAWLRLDEVVPVPEVEGVALPTLLLLVGVLGGLLLAWLARIANGLGAKRRATRAAKALRRTIEAAADELVVDPLETELDAREELCRAVASARR